MITTPPPEEKRKKSIFRRKIIQVARLTLAECATAPSAGVADPELGRESTKTKTGRAPGGLPRRVGVAMALALPGDVPAVSRIVGGCALPFG